MTKQGLHPAAAGAVAAVVWGLMEPIDQWLFRCDYSDVAVLGKAVVRRGWFTVGLTMHALNGALFGVAYDAVRRRVPANQDRLALGMALGEHVAFYPLAFFVDRYHPARGQRGIPRLLRNGRAFTQATVRHAIFGVLLGRLSRPR